jgi:glycosyltransferase involved in cell wall biosynthesis
VDARGAAAPPAGGPDAVRLAVNMRVAAFATGGQQRVAAEVMKRLDGALAISPARPLAGARGHLWEQTVLPWRARGHLLWSPSATGPIAMRRQVVTLHDVAFLDTPDFFTASFRAFYAALIPRLVRNAARIVTVSEFSRRRIVERLGVASEAVAVIGNGVSANFRPQTAAAIARTRAALDLPARYFLLQATSDRRKNLAGALRAWRSALPALPDDLHLVVSGDMARGHVFGEADAAVCAPRARLIGHVAESHMAPLLSGAEAFLFPSRYEGFGLPIVEAMACATPVLTSAATATQEVAAGRALLVDPFSDADIARGFLALARDPDLRARLAAGGPQHAAKFSWDEVGRRYLALFAEVEAAARTARPGAADARGAAGPSL